MARIGEQIDEREIVPVQEPFAPDAPDRAPAQPPVPEPV